MLELAGMAKVLKTVYLINQNHLEFNMAAQNFTNISEMLWNVVSMQTLRYHNFSLKRSLKTDKDVDKIVKSLVNAEQSRPVLVREMADVSIPHQNKFYVFMHSVVKTQHTDSPTESQRAQIFHLMDKTLSILLILSPFYSQVIAKKNSREAAKTRRNLGQKRENQLRIYADCFENGITYQWLDNRLL